MNEAPSTPFSRSILRGFLFTALGASILVALEFLFRLSEVALILEGLFLLGLLVFVVWGFRRPRFRGYAIGVLILFGLGFLAVAYVYLAVLLTGDLM